MYRFIDTVSIDVMSITGYHRDRKPREESTVEAGTSRELRLEGGVIRYPEVGKGPAIHFFHGILANGMLWRNVVARFWELFKTVAAWNIDETTLEAYAGRLMRDAHVGRYLVRFLGIVSNRYTQEAARSFPDFERPGLIAWGDRDPFFSPRLALGRQHESPDGRLEVVAGSRAFHPEDGVGRPAQLIQKCFDGDTTRPRDALPEEVFFGD
jgi:hypothetical protein